MKMIGAILLIAGTSIGAGMLALPVLTAEAGFFPASLLFLGVWALTLFTALLVMEVNLSFKGEVNLITMTRATLGKKAAGVTWVLFLLLLYSLMAAYLSGSGSILNNAIGFTIPFYLEPVIPLLLFGLFIMMGTGVVDICNRILIIGLAAAYLGLVGSALPNVMYSSFTIQNYGLLFAALPVAVSAFGFHIVIPTVASYLKHDAMKIKRAIIFGSLIPLIVYLLWEFVILGVVPLDRARQALLDGAPITEALALVIGAPWVVGFGIAFSFFAIVTSFLGVSVALFGFLKDGLKKESKWAPILTFLPPLIFVELFPNGFIMALEYGGVFVALLSVILPVLMAHQVRKRGWATPYHAPGGRFALGLSILLSLLIITSGIIYSS